MAKERKQRNITIERKTRACFARTALHDSDRELKGICTMLYRE